LIFGVKIGKFCCDFYCENWKTVKNKAKLKNIQEGQCLVLC